MSPLPRIPELDAWLVDATTKGFPGAVRATRLGEIGSRGWNVLRDDLPLPVAIIKASSLEHNRAWMRAYLGRVGAVLCPHGKTTMSPQLFAAQLEDGAFGITCATVAQLQVYRRYGVTRVLMANQLVAARAIDYVIEELARDPGFEIYLLVDSPAGVERLARAARAARLRRPIRVLAEVGSAGARTGARSIADLDRVVEAIEAGGSSIRLHGIEAFEGVFDGSPQLREQAVGALLSFVVQASERARRSSAAAEPWLLSAGGSAYFDLAAEHLRPAATDGAILVLRSGCYLTHDHGTYAAAQLTRATRDSTVVALGEGLRPALEIWTHVQSRPEPGRAYLTAGKRDVSFDVDLPRPIAWLRPGEHLAPRPLGDDHRIVKLNDQHAHLSLPPASPLAIGDLVGLGISHPCTTFDRWQLLYVVDDDYNVIDALRTFF